MDVIRQLSLVKGEERFVFRYQTGQEAEVIDALPSWRRIGPATSTGSTPPCSAIRWDED